MKEMLISKCKLQSAKYKSEEKTNMGHSTGFIENIFTTPVAEPVEASFLTIAALVSRPSTSSGTDWGLFSTEHVQH